MSTYSSKNIYSVLMCLPWLSSMTIGLIAKLYPQFFAGQIAIPLCVFLILCIGIPHGAIDHILYYMELTRRMKRNKSHDERTISWTGKSFLFYWNYLLIMVFWAASWAWNPIPTFWIFMAISAYHFGESDLDYLDIPKPFHHFVFMSRGLLIIGEVASAKPNLTLGIIQKLVNSSDPETYSWLVHYGTQIQHLVIAQHLVVIFILAMIYCYKCRREFILKSNEISVPTKFVPNMKRVSGLRPFYPLKTTTLQVSALVIETLKTLLFVWLFKHLDPLTGFSVYFGLWHSFGSIMNEVALLEIGRSRIVPKIMEATARLEKNHKTDILNGKVCNIRVSLGGLWTFVKLSFLYTSISTTGMLFLYSQSSELQESYNIKGFAALTEIWAIFVIFISILTGPHIWIVSLLHHSSGNLDPFHGKWILSNASISSQ